MLASHGGGRRRHIVNVLGLGFHAADGDGRHPPQRDSHYIVEEARPRQTRPRVPTQRPGVPPALMGVSPHSCSDQSGAAILFVLSECKDWSQAEPAHDIDTDNGTDIGTEIEMRATAWPDNPKGLSACCVAADTQIDA